VNSGMISDSPIMACGDSDMKKKATTTSNGSPDMGNRQFGKLNAYLNRAKNPDGSRKYSPEEVGAMTGRGPDAPRNEVFHDTKAGLK